MLSVPRITRGIQLFLVLSQNPQAPVKYIGVRLDRHDACDRPTTFRHYNRHACLGHSIEKCQATLFELTSRDTRFLMSMDTIHGHSIPRQSQLRPVTLSVDRAQVRAYEPMPVWEPPEASAPAVRSGCDCRTGLGFPCRSRRIAR